MALGRLRVYGYKDETFSIIKPCNLRKLLLRTF